MSQQLLEPGLIFALWKGTAQSKPTQATTTTKKLKKKQNLAHTALPRSELVRCSSSIMCNVCASNREFNQHYGGYLVQHSFAQCARAPSMIWCLLSEYSVAQVHLVVWSTRRLDTIQDRGMSLSDQSEVKTEIFCVFHLSWQLFHLRPLSRLNQFNIFSPQLSLIFNCYSSKIYPCIWNGRVIFLISMLELQDGSFTAEHM